MAKPLNLKKKTRSTWEVILDDEKGTVLLLTTPTKYVFDLILSIQDELSDNEDEITGETIDALFSVCTAILNTNKNGIHFTMEEVSEFLRYDDIIALIQGYTSFVGEVTSSKN